MPTLIATTDANTLESALIPVIAAIVPTHAHSRAIGWTPTEDNAQVGESSECPRLFFLQWVPGEVVPGGLTGNADTETGIGLDVVADYRGFSPEDRGTVVEMDRWDLYDALEDSINVIPGLTHSEAEGEPQPDGDEDAARYRYSFTLHYMRQR